MTGRQVGGECTKRAEERRQRGRQVPVGLIEKGEFGVRGGFRCELLRV